MATAARKLETRDERLRQYADRLRRDPELRRSIKESVEDNSPGLTRDEAVREYLRR
jgi:hypothetical protein